MAEAVATTSETSPTPKGRKGLLIIGAVLAAEALGVFFITKAFNSQPDAAAAAEGESHEAAVDDHGPPPAESGGESGAHTEKQPGGAQVVKGHSDMLAEVELGECRPSNRMSGKLITMQVRVSLLVAESDAETVKSSVESKQARIRDRINFVFRSAEPTFIHEPGLETIKRRIKNELDRIIGQEVLIHEVLIPEMLQSGSGS